MIEKLKKSILENNEEEMLKIIEIIGNEKNELALPTLLDIFNKTSNNIIRNTVALALGDIGNPIVIEPIVQMIFNPITQNNRGTLIYALNNYECSKYIKQFIKLIYTGNYEVSREAFNLVELNYLYLSNKEKEECEKLIKEEIEKANDRLELLSEVYNIFSKKE